MDKCQPIRRKQVLGQVIFIYIAWYNKCHHATCSIHAYALNSDEKGAGKTKNTQKSSSPPFTEKEERRNKHTEGERGKSQGQHAQKRGPRTADGLTAEKPK